MFTSPLLWSKRAKNVTLIPAQCETGIQESLPSPADFQLHMHTPHCLPVFHFPVCWLKDMIVKEVNRMGEGERGVTVYLCTCTSVCKQEPCGLIHTQSWERGSVPSVIPVMSIKLEWLTGRVWDGDGMGENGPRPWEVSEQAADNVDVITQELTGRDLMGKS